MLSFLRSKFPRPDSAGSTITQINGRRRELVGLQDSELKRAAEDAQDINEIIAVTAVVAARVLGLEMFDVQLRGALALANGRIVEMQTGEGKTLTAVPPIIWYAKDRGSIHVMTVNDYLALRDARWMGGIYEFFGLTVGCIQQGMDTEERKHAYASDITYATANEIGFDYLRDQIALYANHQVHRPFAAALVDEADSILIDEARIPLVVAGSESDQDAIVFPVDHLVRRFRPLVHYTLDEHGRNVALTDAGVEAVEHAFDRSNLFAEENLALHTAVQNSLHAHALLRRDVDYLVKNGAIESVDEIKGRIVQERRWPAALHTAIEVKEGVAPKVQGRVLGSITMENLLSLYPKVCGMTGTATTQAMEFQSVYGLEVEAIPTNRPVIRVDHPDVIFRTLQEKEQAVLEEIRREHEKGRPVLVGTVSVEESERLGARLGNIPRQILNARNEEEEAAIIARAGERAALTISTNMAGRGTDIKLGAGVAELGGLHVIGTNRHESRRIDNQLRGRAGRQGDPGSSRFFVSYQDDLMVKYGINDPKLKHDPESIQRMVEGESLDIRNFLHKYEGVVEGQRQTIEQRRQGVLTGATVSSTEMERLVSLTVIDDLWAEHLAAITELREGIHWVELGGRVPIHEYLKEIHKRFEDLEARIPEEVRERLAEAKTGRRDPSRRGATWTYLTTDLPFGNLSDRIARGWARKFRRWST